MPDPIQPSFSPRRRWKIGADMFVRAVLVLAVAVMANYIGAQFVHRFYLSSQTRLQLSPRTLSLLHSLTNRVTVTLYYDTNPNDTDGQFYPTILALLNEYHAANPNISVRTVDYAHDPIEAEKVRAQYSLPGAVDSPNAPPSKNLIIFDNGKRSIVIPGAVIVRYTLEQIAPDDPKQKEMEFRRKPVEFNGEVMFTAKLLELSSSQPFRAYFLQGHGEPSLADSSLSGYLKFATVLHENYVDVEPLSLLGDSDVPRDCNLLIVAGPVNPLSELELQKIRRYLAQGGRLFALFNYASRNNPTGLEEILSQDWDVNVGADVVQDLENTTSSSGLDVVVSRFSQHPVVNPLIQSELQMYMPRPVSRVDLKNPPADAPLVTELAFSGDRSKLMDDTAEPPRSYSLMAAVEQKAGAGVANPRGNARMVVAGDSIFLDNQVIAGGLGGANRDFLGYAVNWLLDRSQLVTGIGPRPVTEFRLEMTKMQQREIRWVLLGALPGAVLLLGGLVWLARRK